MTLSVVENRSAGTNVGSVRAVDEGNPGTGTTTENVTYHIESRADASFFEIDERSGAITTTTTLNREEKSPRTISVRATDPFGGSDTVTVSIEVTDDPEAPVITSGSTNERYRENDTRIVSTYTATDQEDDKARESLIWSLTGTDADRFEINQRGELRFRAAPDFEDGSDNEHVVTVTVSDNEDPPGTATQQVTVNVINLDEPGEVALPRMLPRVQPKVGFETTAGVTDTDGSVTDLTWQWAKSTSRSGPWTDIEENSTSTAYTPIAADFNHYLRATARYKTDSDPVVPADDPTTLDVDESFVEAHGITDDRVARGDYTNAPPVFQDAEGTATTTGVRMVDENSPEGTNVGLPVEATDLDVNGDQENLSYEILETGTDHEFFTIVEGTGQIRVGTGPTVTDVEVPFDYEDVDNEDHQFTLTVRATDPSGLNTETARQNIMVTVMVAPVEEDPEIVEETETENLSEKDYNEEQATSTSPISLYDAEDDEDDSNIAPLSPKDLKWTLSGRDADDFMIATSTPDTLKQELTFKEMPNYERPTDSNSDNVYNVTVVVTDSAGRTDTRDVVVRVKNIDEPGTVTLSNLQPEAGIPITATLEDPDGGLSNVRWQWHTSGNDQLGSPVPGADATSQTYIPLDVHATPTRFFLQAHVTYNDNASVEDDPATTVVDEFDHKLFVNSANQVQVKDDSNETPQFTDQDPNSPGKQTTRQIPERMDSNGEAVQPSVVQGPVTATDEPEANNDAGEVLTYSMSGPDAGLFTIDRGTDSDATPAMVAGQIRVAEGTELDYESRKTYTVVVTATDPSLATDQITVTIEVTDFDEDPVIMQRGLLVGGDTAISYDENGTASVARYIVSGADAPGATWSLEGTDAGQFSITSGGELSFRGSPNYEAPTDQGGNNVYNVTVKATSGDLSASRNVTVTIENIDEPGTVNISSANNEVKVDVELTAELDEQDDEDPASVTWQWARGDSDTGPWNNISGATNNTYSPVEADVASFLQATVTYNDPLGSGKILSAETETAVEAVSTADNPGTVTLSPTTQLTVDDTVTAILTDPDNPTNHVWRWERSADGSTNWSTISAATSASYTTTDDDAGNYLRATVTYDDDSGAGQTEDATTSSAVKLHRYDDDASGEIERDEVIAAINAYLFGTGTERDEVIEVINLYLFG